MKGNKGSKSRVAEKIDEMEDGVRHITEHGDHETQAECKLLPFVDYQKQQEQQHQLHWTTKVCNIISNMEKEEEEQNRKLVKKVSQE